MASTTGKQLVSAAWQGLRQDKELIILPVLGAMTTMLAGAVLFVGGKVIGVFDSLATTTADGSTSVSPVAAVGAVVSAYVLTVISLYFQTAVIVGANIRMDGGDPDVGSSLRGAYSHIGGILRWALVVTTVNVVLKAVRDNSRGLGQFAVGLAGIAWNVATFFALPVVIFERIGPIEAVKRSGAMIKGTWGQVARTSIRFGLWVLLAWFAVVGMVLGGITAAFQFEHAGWIGLSAIGIVAGAVLGLVTNTLSGYIKVALYRFASGMQVPGIPQEVMAGAFASSGN